jgi:valyl-tRNA synthetase
MSEKRVEGYRHFINKLWNAARFSLMHLDEGFETIDAGNISLQDRWILSRLNRVARQTEAALDAYRFNEAAGAVYQFVWHELCDWYLEAIKPTLYDDAGSPEKAATLSVLWHVFKDALVLLHPFAPFVTEEIWHSLPGTEGSIMKADWPDHIQPGDDPAAETQMETVMAVITGIRNVRGEMNISPSTALTVAVHPGSPGRRLGGGANRDLIENLARLNGITVDAAMQRPKAAATVLIRRGHGLCAAGRHHRFRPGADASGKRDRQADQGIVGHEQKLGNEDFLKKAPAQVVDGVREKHAAMLEKQHALEATLERITAMMVETMHTTDDLIQLALKEDIGPGDITTDNLVAPETRGKGVIVAKQELVVAGLRVAEKVFSTLEPTIDFDAPFADGDRIPAGSTVVRIAGYTGRPAEG